MENFNAIEHTLLPVKEAIKSLPDKPGVYQFFDSEKQILYVGKAKELKKRVSSYFIQKPTDRKTRSLVSKIAFLQFTIVSSESDALLLENNLIKHKQPKYNILLRDDKTFPYICLTHEAFPRIITTRRLNAYEGTYFGPFTSVSAMNTVVEFLRKTFNIRTCRLPLNEDGIKQNKFKVCLEYHLKNCLGPCEAHQSNQEYTKSIELARHVLRGDITSVKSSLHTRMQLYAGNMAYEQAQSVKFKLDKLDRYQSKSVVSNPDLGEIDVFTMVHDEQKAFVNYTKVNNGMVIHSENFRIDKKLNEEAEHIVQYALPEIRNKYRSQTATILTNVEAPIDIPNTAVQVPKIGDKRKLVELSLKNLLMFKNEYLLAKTEQKDRSKESLQHLQKALSLKELPVHIECFDNSNLQGSNPVASMVCFLNGKPAKKEYRHFSIKTVQGPDDFSSMKEIVGRRYQRVIHESLPIPQLIVIDGGKGQLSAAVEVLKELGIFQNVAIVGIAKRLEELYFPGDSEPIHLHKKSPALILIQQIRNEAHRFAITYHRQKRSKQAVGMQLQGIRGIGPKTLEVLYKEFKTLKGIQEASTDELTVVVGKSKAKLIKQESV